MFAAQETGLDDRAGPKYTGMELMWRMQSPVQGVVSKVVLERDCTVAAVL